MQFSTILLTLAPLFTLTAADLHSAAVCVTGRKFNPVGGTPFSPTQTWAKDFEILTEATKCACEAYKRRNTGNKQFDVCPDCTFVSFEKCLGGSANDGQDGLQCVSQNWHIGGDEFTYYCEDICHAQGAETNPA